MDPPAGTRDIGAVYSLLGSSDGTLWIGTAEGLFSWKNNNLRKHVQYRINSILEDRDHRIWAARSRVSNSSGGLCQVVGDHPGCMGGDAQMRLPYAGSLAQDTQGNLWIGSSNELMRWNKDGFARFFGRELEPFQALGSVEGIAAAKDGSVWVAIPRKGLGLFRILQAAPVKYKLPNAATEQANALFVAHDDSLWAGTINHCCPN